MKGTELRAWRTSRGLYQRDVVRIAQEAGMASVDQPMVSEFERGLLEVPAELDAALAAVAADYDVVAEPTPAAPPRRPKRERSRRRDPEPEPDEPDVELPEEDQPPAPGDDADGDRPPRPVPAPGPISRGVQAVTWDTGVRNQLEKDLRVLFAGDTFLVPVPVGQPDGSVVYAHEEAFQPGIAQLVGYMDEFDGQVIAMNAAGMARAWANLADESPRVRRLLLMLTYGGAWRGVFAATLPALYAIGVHHGLIPPVLGGAGAAPVRQVPEADGVPVA